MRLRHKKGAEDLIKTNPYCIHIDENGTLTPFFHNDNLIELELGMGKGKFICEMAKLYPHINFIGIEKSATITLKAIDLFKEGLISPSDTDLIPNLLFMCEDVENLYKYFKPYSIDKIFLNFSDPWPKKRHEHRRLTHGHFLNIYHNLLKDDGILEFKTDNVGLFNFTLEQLKMSPFEIIYHTYDLHNDPILNKDNIMTEYEAKFSAIGNKICKVCIKNKK